MSAGPRVALCALVALLAAGCASLGESEPRAPYVPDRRDYAAFRASQPDVLEPNYLPFMAHRIELGDGRERLVLCRWEADDFPLPVHVEAPL